MTRIPRPTFDHVLLFIAVVTASGGVWIFTSPGGSAAQIQSLYSPDGGLPPLMIGAFIAGVLGVMTIVRISTGIAEQLDRSPITNVAPEQPAESPVPRSSVVLGETYDEVLNQFEYPSNEERRVAMYGCRAKHGHDLSEEMAQFFAELQITARDAYATAESVDAGAAEEAVVAGEWTDDRVAAAFLASDRDATPQFTWRERAAAWIAPKRVFERRSNRVIEALETTGTVFLTYENPNTNSSEVA